MFAFIITLIVIAGVILTLVVLAQNSKGGGLSSQFGGGGTSQVMGVKRTGDLLERLTWGLAIAIMVLSLSSYIFLKNGGQAQSGFSSPSVERAQEQNVMPPMSNELPLEEGTVDSSADGNSLPIEVDPADGEE